MEAVDIHRFFIYLPRICQVSIVFVTFAPFFIRY